MKYIAINKTTGSRTEVTEDGKTSIQNNPHTSGKYRFEDLGTKGSPPVEVIPKPKKTEKSKTGK